ATLLMWAFLLYLIVMRKKINKGTGRTNQDHEWTFGQVLALATWAPVLIEFTFICLRGRKAALNGLISNQFVVTDAHRPEES
ncbi:hypothetical protein K458DRAFT_273430, partial [Lentithecium fluviatile CBS 122367]